MKLDEALTSSEGFYRWSQRFGFVIFLTDPDPTRKPKADPDLDPGGKGKKRIFFRVFFSFRMILKNVQNVNFLNLKSL